jgi:cytochrome c553
MMRVRMRFRHFIAPLIAAAACVATSAGAADLAAGKAKANEVCASCHGLDGNSTSQDFPKLGGQYPDYLAKSLRDYKSGDRKNAIMASFAKPLSTQDIDNLAAYYAAQPAVVSSKH